MDAVDLTADLRAAQDGDEVAMARLFRALNPPLLRYLRHRAPDGADDLASECWMAVAKAIAGFEGDADDLRAWLFGVARRQVANYWRRAHRGLRVVRTGEVPEVPEVTDVGDVVIEALSAQEAVGALLQGLSPDQAEVLLLRVVAGLSVEQVAALLDRRPGTIRVAQHRALRRLARQLRPDPVTR